MVRDNKTFTLRPELGTASQVYYIGLNESIADPEFAFLNRSAQLRERYITFKRNTEVGGIMGGNIISSDMGLLGLIRQGLHNFTTFFVDAPKKLFRGLF